MEKKATKQKLTLLIDNSKVKILKDFLQSHNYVEVQTEDDDETSKIEATSCQR